MSPFKWETILLSILNIFFKKTNGLSKQQLALLQLSLNYIYFKLVESEVKKLYTYS